MLTSKALVFLEPSEKSWRTASERLDVALHVLRDYLCYTVTRATTRDSSRGKGNELLPLRLAKTPVQRDRWPRTLSVTLGIMEATETMASSIVVKETEKGTEGKPPLPALPSWRLLQNFQLPHGRCPKYALRPGGGSC